MKNTTILDEASRIKTLLLKVQAEVEAIALKKQAELLKDSRKQLGYDEVDVESDKALIDARVSKKTAVITPKMLSMVLPVSKKSVKTTGQSRKEIDRIIDQKSDKLVVIVGPCSIHDPKSALEYAGHVKQWRKTYGNDLEIVMRAYMEKPRTELGWKGFIYDPRLDESNDINLGVVATRMLACAITDMGVPIAMERLNALTPQYVNALVAYDAIGARNTTDQKAREYASATSSPVGFKNTPEGSIEAAVQGIVSANGAHAFLGTGMNGTPHQIDSSGNDKAHIILRGAAHSPNYSVEDVAKTKELLNAKDLKQAIIIDASHGNSLKQAKRQLDVIKSVCQQISTGEKTLCGVMIESNLVFGTQKLKNPNDLIYGQSITDECVGIDDTESMLQDLASAAQTRRKNT